MISKEAHPQPVQIQPDPKDPSIRARAQALLGRSGHEPLARVHCQVQEGVVILSGVVPSYYLKQLAQATVQRVESVRGVRNLVRVA